MAQNDDISNARRPAESGVGMPPQVPGADRPTDAGTKSTREWEIIRRALKRFERAVEAESGNRKEAIEDLEFKVGRQWPTDIQAQRNAQKRPCLTINKVPTFTHQITNDQKQNRPSIHISPVGDRSDKNAAKMYAGMIKRIEYDSGAELAIDTAFEKAVDMGWGYWRFVTEYESDESFDQVVVWKRVRNPFTVYLDPDAQDPNGADSKWGFVTEMVDRDEFKHEWPGKNPCNWQQGGQGDAFKNWITEKKLRIAEYYEKVFTKRKYLYLDTGAKIYEDELDPAMKARLFRGEGDTPPGMVKVRKEREVECVEIKWYKLTCVEILEETDWLGTYIPIVKVIGEETDIQGKVHLQGAIRRMKDPQRMKNYWATVKTEAVALAPLAPYIMAEGQAEGHENEWKMANKKSFAVLFYKPTAVNGTMVPPPQRQQFTGVPAALVEAEHGSEQDMMAASGIRFDATMQERTQDESGKALEHLRRNSDLGTYHYVDNLSSALKLSGQILIELIEKYYDTRRTVTILREDDVEQRIVLDPNADKPYQEIAQNEQKPNGPRAIFNPTIGKYGVRVTIGPSYATRRIEAARSMMEFVKIFPQAAARIGDLIAKYQDWPGADEITARLVPPEFAQQHIKDLPPQAQGIVVNLMNQVKELAMHRQQLIKQVNDQTLDRAVDLEKIHRDFEAKVLKVVADLEKHGESIGQKIASDVLGVIQSLIKPEPTGGTTGQSSGASSS